MLLNANVAFLDIGNVTPEDALQSTVGQVASFISIITSTGSVIIGLLLLRQHRVNSQEDARDAVCRNAFLVFFVNTDIAP